jgi:hypothetical protein
MRHVVPRPRRHPVTRHFPSIDARPRTLAPGRPMAKIPDVNFQPSRRSPPSNRGRASATIRRSGSNVIPRRGPFRHPVEGCVELLPRFEDSC